MARAVGKAIAEQLESVINAVQPRGYSQGLNPAQWAALRFFARASLPAATVSDFAAHHGTTKGTASSTVSALVKKKLLARQSVPDDGRSHILRVTRQGKLRLSADPFRDIETAARRLDRAQQLALVDALEALLTELLSGPSGKQR